jgi:hypothetical protein
LWDYLSHLFDKHITKLNWGLGRLSSTGIHSVVDLAYTLLKFTSTFVRCVIKRYSFRNLPRTVHANSPLGKRKRMDPTENPGLGTELTGILTVATSGCRPQPVRTSPALGWSEIAVKPSRSGRVSRVAQQPDFLHYKVKTNVKP